MTSFCQYLVCPETVKECFSGCSDFQFRSVRAGETDIAAFVCWIDGTVSGDELSSSLLRPLTDPVRFGRVRSEEDVFSILSGGGAYCDTMRVCSDMDTLVTDLCFGSCAVVFQNRALLFQLKTSNRRGIEEPTVEKSVKGSRESFSDVLRQNTALVRSRLRTPALKLTEITVGRKSRTKIAVMWMEGVTSPELPGEVLRRLREADIDGVLMPDTLDRILADAPRSPLPQLLHTERPDMFASALLDGRVGILTDGFPLGLAAPVSLPVFMRTPQDRGQHYIIASFVILLRWVSLLLTLLLPAFYVAIATFHPEMIPLKLLLSLIDAKQAVPFSTAVEVIGMLISFELLQEAGLRLPNPVGQTVSIIGALIVGQSAVDARVISPIAVIIVAMAGIAGYTMPSQDLGAALRLGRLGLVLCAALGGMFGIVIGGILILWHISCLESFGRPYAAGLSGDGGQGTERPFIRRAPWKNTLRPPLINGGDLRRQK